MSRNHNIEPTGEQGNNASERLRTAAKRGLAVLAIGTALFGFGKGLESGSNIQEDAAHETISQVYDTVPEAGEGTFVGDILEGASHSTAGGLSENIELAMNLNENGNVITPVYAESVVAPTVVDAFDSIENSPAVSLADSQGRIPRTDDMVNDLHMAQMQAKTSEILDGASDVTQITGAAGMIAGGIAAAGASAAALGRTRKE